MNNAQKRLQLEMLRNAKGFVLDALGRYEGALKAFESARRFSGNGNVKIACCGKGLVFAHLGDWEKTFKAFDRILVFDPENAQASVVRAFALIRLQKFEKAASILEECLKLKTPKFKTPDEVKKPASLLLKSIRAGPLRPSWWKWLLDAETNGLIKKAGFWFIFLLIFSLLLSHPAASSLPIVSWPASFINRIFSAAGTEYISWALYSKEYLIFIRFLLAVLLTPALRFGRWEKEELELEVLTLPAPDFDIPVSILDEFTERLEKNLFSPEPMEERMQKLIKF